jgi:hypothetical protein
MTSNLFLVLPLSLLLVANNLYAGTAGSNQIEQNVTVNVNVNQNPYTNYGPASVPLTSGAGLGYYSNLLNTCAAATENLSYTRELAEDDARAGNFKEASRKLFEALIYEAGNIGTLPYAPFPHTALAITEAAFIANQLRTALLRAGTPSPNPTPLPSPGPGNPPAWFPAPIQLPITANALNQVEFLVLSQLYNVVNRAYGIDARWYTSLIVPRCYQNWRTCYSSSYSPNPYWLPQEYFDGVRELAIAILEAQKQIQHLQYSDIVEFAVAGAVAKSAKAILMTALYRRDLICSIRELHMLEARIGYVQSGGSSLTDIENRNRIRGLMARAISNLSHVCMPSYPTYPTLPPHLPAPGYPAPYPVTPIQNPPFIPYQSGPEMYDESAYSSPPVESPYVDRYGNYRVDIRDRENLDRVLNRMNSERE